MAKKVIEVTPLQKEGISGFDFSITKSKIDCIHNAIDLPNNQFAVSVQVDLMAGMFGEVKQGIDVIGECTGINAIRNLYRKAVFTIQLNISEIDWSEDIPDLFFRVSARSVFQLPNMREVGTVFAAETALKTAPVDNTTIEEMEYRKQILAGKSLENRDELFEKIEMHVYSKFHK